MADNKPGWILNNAGVIFTKWKFSKYKNTSVVKDTDKNSGKDTIKDSKKNSNKISMESIDRELMDCPDITRKRVYVDNHTESYFIYLNEFIDNDILQRDFIKPILTMSLKELSDEKKIYNLPCAKMKLLYTLEDVIDGIMAGDSVFICKALDYAVACTVMDIDTRGIEEPQTEKNIRGPHEGFVESIDTNYSVLRRKVKSNRLKIKKTILGKQTRQTVAITYIEGVANIDIVNSLYDKISSIEIDGLSAIGYVEQIITANHYSIFPQFLSTERPDKAVASLLEGRIVILQEGTPVVLVAPINFLSFFQALDDYSTLWIHGSFLRMLRLIAIVLAVVMPSLYIAITSFHYYIVPLNLLIPIAESRAKVPFPPIVEVLILEIVVEMVREAAVRLPSYISTAIGIFATLVIGQASVEAGIVSNILIVIVGASAVASYVIPSFDMSMSIRILRFGFSIATSIFGAIGMVICTALTLAHLTSMQSLGQPYFQPITPLVIRDFKDAFFRLPIKSLEKRPAIVKTKNKSRGKRNGRK